MLCAVRIQILQEADKQEKQPRCKLICSCAALLEIIQPFPPQRADVSAVSFMCNGSEIQNVYSCCRGNRYFQIFFSYYVTTI